MQGSANFPREIRVYVRDTQWHLIPDSRIECFENDVLRGTVEHSDGHASFFPADANSVVRINVDYKGKRQTLTLAVDERQCTFQFSEVSGATVTQADPTSQPGPLWRNPTVVAAVITGIVTLVGVYFAYIYKSASTEIHLAVYVKDATTGRPLSRAMVTLQRASRREPRIADDRGMARFVIAKDLDKDLTINAEAAGYQDGTLAYDAPSHDDNVELPLTPLPQPNATQPKPAITAKRPAPAVPSAPSGTWQVEVSGDPSLLHVEGGVFVFSPQPDGNILISGKVRLDGVDTALEGHAGRQNREIFLTFAGKSSVAPWNGTGQFDLLPNNRMSGHITNSSGAAVPITLKKP